MASSALRAFQVGSSLARALPGPVVELVVRSSGLAPSVAGDRRRQVERNLRRVYGPDFGGLRLRRAVAATFESYARYWAESFRLADTSPAAIEAGITIDGWEQVEAAREAGTGAILAMPHLGSWEWAGMWVTRCREVPMTAVVEALEPRDVYEWFVALRERFDLHVVPLGPDAASAVLRALADNQVVALLCDRDIAGGGIPVTFFGEVTSLPGGPALLAHRSGAPLFPTAVFYEGRQRRGIIRPALDTARRGKLRDDVARITQDLAGELEALIRRAPEQWHLMQPNWPSDRGEAAS